MARSPAKRLVGSLLFLLAAILVLGFLFLLYANSINDDAIPLVDELKAVALVVVIVLAVVAVTLLVLLLVRSWSDRAEKAAAAEVFFIPDPSPAPRAATTEFVAGSDLTVYALARVPTGSRAWGASEGAESPFYFPRAVGGGFYVNDYIPIDGKGRVLKLRTLLGGPYDPIFTDEAAPEPAPTPAPRVVRSERRVEPATTAGSTILLQEVSTKTLAPATTEEVYYDYPGDSHEVEELEGIGPTYGKRLRDAGVLTTARLCYEDAGKLANAVQVPRGTVEAWQQMAQLVKVKGIGPQYAEVLVRAGIGGIEELKRRSPARMADQVNAYLDTLDVNIVGNKITEKRIEGWKEAAKQLKRIRLAVPAQ